MQAEFTEMVIAFDGIFDKLNTALARLAKREQARAEETARLLAVDPTRAGHASEDPAEAKAALRRRAFGLEHGTDPAFAALTSAAFGRPDAPLTGDASHEPGH
jgi:hypothetical protein